VKVTRLGLVQAWLLARGAISNAGHGRAWNASWRARHLALFSPQGASQPRNYRAPLSDCRAGRMIGLHGQTVKPPSLLQSQIRVFARWQ
jgi:hypothetical protein